MYGTDGFFKFTFMNHPFLETACLLVVIFETRWNSYLRQLFISQIGQQPSYTQTLLIYVMYKMNYKNMNGKFSSITKFYKFTLQFLLSLCSNYVCLNKGTSYSNFYKTNHDITKFLWINLCIFTFTDFIQTLFIIYI